MSLAQTQQRKPPMRLPTVRPAVRPAAKKEPTGTVGTAKTATDFAKPIVTTMNRMFPSVDKLCDAPWIKKITGLGTKKAALLFIAENSMVYNFFNSMEVKMRENNVFIRKDIEHFFQTKEVLIALSAFKVQVKQIEAEQKILKKKQEEEAIVEEARERIEQEAKNRILAEYLQSEALAAKKRGDEKASKEFSAKAMKLMEEHNKQQEALEAKTTESSDSDRESDDQEDGDREDEDYVDNSKDHSNDGSEDGSSSSHHSKSSKRSEKSASVSTNSKTGSQEQEGEKKADDKLDINRVIDIINATNDAGYLLVKHGNKEYKLMNLVLDRVNAKLVLNIEPTVPEKAPVKVSFD